MSEKERFTIYINSEEKVWQQSEIQYNQVVDIAFPPPHKSTEIFTVQYSVGSKDNPKGTMVKGQKVSLIDKMIFNVARTDKS